MVGFEQVIVFPPQVAGTALTEIDTASAAVKAVYPILTRCQVKEWGCVISTIMGTNATDPIVKLGYQHPIGASTTYISAMTLGSSNTKLRKYTTNPDAVAAGGPGTVTVGPSIGGHTTVLATDATLVVGTIVLADTKSLPSVVLQPGDLLLVEVTTAATTSGKIVVFARLDVAQGEQYTTAYVNYDATP